MAQAEAEYKDFILFYPNMEEAAEAQYKICDMQYLQMDKADRDHVHARLGDAECKDVIQKWPNSKYATEAAKIERDDSGSAGRWRNEGRPNSTRRRAAMATSPPPTGRTVWWISIPLYSRADDALWVAVDDYNQMGDKYENKQAECTPASCATIR